MPTLLLLPAKIAELVLPSRCRHRYQRNEPQDRQDRRQVYPTPPLAARHKIARRCTTLERSQPGLGPWPSKAQALSAVEVSSGNPVRIRSYPKDRHRGMLPEAWLRIGRFYANITVAYPEDNGSARNPPRYAAVSTGAQGLAPSRSLLKRHAIKDEETARAAPSPHPTGPCPSQPAASTRSQSSPPAPL